MVSPLSTPKLHGNWSLSLIPNGLKMENLGASSFWGIRRFPGIFYLKKSSWNFRPSKNYLHITLDIQGHLLRFGMTGPPKVPNLRKYGWMSTGYVSTSWFFLCGQCKRPCFYLLYAGDDKRSSGIFLGLFHKPTYKDPGTLNNQDDSWKVSGRFVIFRGSKVSFWLVDCVFEASEVTYLWLWLDCIRDILWVANMFCNCTAKTS